MQIKKKKEHKTAIYLINLKLINYTTKNLHFIYFVVVFD